MSTERPWALGKEKKKEVRLTPRHAAGKTERERDVVSEVKLLEEAFKD